VGAMTGEQAHKIIMNIRAVKKSLDMFHLMKKDLPFLDFENHCLLCNRMRPGEIITNDWSKARHVPLFTFYFEGKY